MFSPLASICNPSRVVRCARYSLRTVFLVLTVCGIGLGWRVREVREQRDAVQAIRAHAAQALYDYQEEPRGSAYFNTELRPPVSGRLIATVGEDFFFTVTGVSLAFGEFPAGGAGNEGSCAEVLRRVAALPRLRMLILHECNRTDDDMRLLRGLTNLERLTIPDASRVTDAGIGCLAELTKLKRLDLVNYRTTDEGLRCLGRLTSLEDLALTMRVDHPDQRTASPPPRAEAAGSIASPCALKGLAQLSKLNKLRVLDLSFNKAVSDAWLWYIGQLSHLVYLDLSGTDVTSSGLMQLARLKKLESLDLSWNHSVGDDGLRAVGELTELESLDLSDTRITSVSLDALKRLKKLKLLILSFNLGITDEGARVLGEMVNLQELHLDYTGITPSGARYLRRLRSLRYLSLAVPCGTDFSVQRSVQKALEEALPCCTVQVLENIQD